MYIASFAFYFLFFLNLTCEHVIRQSAKVERQRKKESEKEKRNWDKTHENNCNCNIIFFE